MTPSKRVRSSSTGSSGTPKDGSMGTPIDSNRTTPKNSINNIKTTTPLSSRVVARHPDERKRGTKGSSTVRDSVIKGKGTAQRRSLSPVSSFASRSRKENGGSSYQRSKPFSSSGQVPSSKRSRIQGSLLYSRLPSPSQHGSGHVHQ